MRIQFPATWFKICLILLITALSTKTFSQVKKSSYQILGITTVGNKTADEATIIANSGLKIGTSIDIPGDATVTAIKRLWALNIFSDVQISIDKEVNSGVFLLITVKEHPRIEKTMIIGNDEIKQDDIMEKVSFVRGQILKEQEIYRIRGKINTLYESKGLLNASIEPELYNFLQADTSKDIVTVTWRNTKDFSKEVKTEYDLSKRESNDIVKKVSKRSVLVYRISEGEIAKVTHIEFVGNKAFDQDDLKGEFKDTKESRWWRFWKSSKLKKEDYEKDKELLTKYYRKNGFRDFVLLADSLIYSPNKKEVTLRLFVYEGPKYYLKGINWTGNSVYTDRALTNQLGMEPGDVYDYEKFQQNLHFNEKQTDVSSLYQDNGYLAFNLDPTETKVGKDSIEINVKVTEGNRFKIGKVEISGNHKTMDKVIRRELFTVPGDYFSRANILRSIQQLANLQFFNTEKLYQEGVNPRPETDSTVTLPYKIEEKSSDYLNASVGYSGSYGFSGSVGVTLTNFYLNNPFQMGAGQVLSFSWQFGVGNYYRTFNLGFTEPWFMDTPTMLGFDLFDTKQQYIYYLQQTGGSVKTGRRLSWPDNYFSVEGMAKFQYNDVLDGAGYYKEGLSRQYTLGATISRTDIDNPTFPSKGSKFLLDYEISGGPFLPGNVDYYKVSFKSEWYKRLFDSNRLAFYLSTDIGYLDELTSGTPIQPFDYYYMGGNGMVIATTPLRGYDDRTVGPRNSSNDVIGGRLMIKHTLELRASLAQDPMPIYLLAFAEAGNCFLDLKSADIFNLRRSAGVGARIMINPIGLVGFDFGYGFDRKEVDGVDPKWMFHFQFGKGF